MASTLTFAVPVEWSKTSTYTVNTIVFVGKRAYTAIQDVPTGIEITNTSYWIETGVPTADVDALRTQLNSLSDTVEQNTDDIAENAGDIVTLGNSITTVSNNLATATQNLNDATKRLDNIMITLYTPVQSS